jgi:glycosyltransferase involved in cell wall biosynthesis
VKDEDEMMGFNLTAVGVRSPTSSWRAVQPPQHQPLTVLALMDTAKVSGPARGLFQLVKLAREFEVRFVLAMFLIGGASTTPAIEDAKRRGCTLALLSQRGRYDPTLILQAYRVLRNHRVDIIQSHSYKPALMAWLLKRLTGLPWVAFTHGYTSENARMALYNRLDRWLLRRADRVVAVSGALKRHLEASGVPAERIHIVYNAVDPDDHAPERDGRDLRRQWEVHSDELLVGVIGRFSPEKGHAVFVEAFSEVARMVPRAKAAFIGDGQELRRVQDLVRSRGLASRVIFAGHRSEMSSVYGALDLIVIPSYSEGLPNVLLEAMLHGKAVVATAVGGIPEVMPPGLSEWLVPPADAPALAGKMREALGDATRRMAHATAGQAHIRRAFSPAARAGQLAALYREVAEPGVSGADGQ